MLLTGLRHIAQLADELGDKYDKTFFSSRRLVVFDDIFPHPLSAFRFAEFTTYLEAFRFSEVHSTGAALPFMHEIRTLSHLIRDFGRVYPASGGVCSSTNQSVLPRRACSIVFF